MTGQSKIGPSETFPRVDVEMPTAIRDLIFRAAHYTCMVGEVEAFLKSLPDTPWEMRESHQHKVVIYYGGYSWKSWVVIRASGGRYERVVKFECWSETMNGDRSIDNLCTVLMPYNVQRVYEWVRSNPTMRIRRVGPTGRRLISKYRMAEIMHRDVFLGTMLRMSRHHADPSATPTEFVVADLQAEYRRIQNSWVQHYGLPLR